MQLLDGVGAGIYQALTPLVIADVMRGTGRYNLALGAVATTQGVGAAISGLFAGVTVDRFGYSTAFLALAAAASVAFAVFALFMPETRSDGAGAEAPVGAARADISSNAARRDERPLPNSTRGR